MQTVVKLTIDRADAQRVEETLFTFGGDENTPSVTAFAPEEGAPVFHIEAYFPSTVDEAALSALLAPADIVIEPLPEVDWVSKSQSMLPPITAGRFHVYGAHVAETLKPGQIGLWIEANQAFGTGRHETTFGCLLALDWLTKRKRYGRALDLGCGSGVLGFGLAKAQLSAVTMSDLDPISIDVAAENARLNQLKRTRSARRNGADLLAVAGTQHPRIQAGAPYDLILANILARPLQALAKSVCAIASPKAEIVLAGLLDSQEAAVLSKYRVFGWRLKKRIKVGQWPTLILQKVQR